MTGFPEVPIVSIQCQAVQCCQSRAGKQCPDRAVAFHGHHAVCWVHRQALRNPLRARPVEFIAGEFTGEE